ncbi:hypothetical protein DYB37_007379 [Aphanomyces astaci]|uniref:RRM domain-containing protein n=1 Tax=Aphanomyces astaci TaxID=112090 RepID=A0A3L6UTP7_APHAT|nr:hypothetical protein DYB35_005437 [Aphanomyces astaci]RHZ05861.1 hypothetical protein DYB37_007379 [Aphanomyces astaci]RLN99886.1 hypothetical protein DYB28_003719 [Aphanomyces astaci]
MQKRGDGSSLMERAAADGVLRAHNYSRSPIVGILTPHQRISPNMADEHDVASTSAAKKASKKQKKQQKQETADVEAAAPVSEQSVAADETAVKSKKASKKSKQQKQEAVDIEAATAPVADQTVATVEPTKASKKSKQQKKEAADVEVPVQVVELVPELASFFSTSSQVFGKRIEPEIKLPVVVAQGADDSTSEQLAAATSTPAPPESRDAVAKKVKKPKHKKVKALAEAAAAAAASGGDGADLATKPSTETPVVAASAPTIQEEEEDEENAVDVKDPRTIFVGNVSLEATAADVKKFFTSCGKVESVRLRSVPVAGCKVDQNGKQNLVKKVCVNKKLFVQGRDSCNAYVVFATDASVDAALKLNGSEFFNKVLRVDRKAVSMDAKRSVFVGNLAFNATDDDVRSHFDKILREDADTAAVESVRIIRDKVTHLGKGFGYVLFKKPELKFEGRRAHPGAQLRLLKKRKAEEPADGAPPSKLPDQKKKPGFIVRGEKKPFDKTNKAPFDKTSKKPFDKTNKKPFDKKKGGAAKGFNSFKKGGYQDKSKASKAPRAKIQKPKHAARKARQALEKA